MNYVRPALVGAGKTEHVRRGHHFRHGFRRPRPMKWMSPVSRRSETNLRIRGSYSPSGPWPPAIASARPGSRVPWPPGLDDPVMALSLYQRSRGYDQGRSSANPVSAAAPRSRGIKDRGIHSIGNHPHLFRSGSQPIANCAACPNRKIPSGPKERPPHPLTAQPLRLCFGSLPRSVIVNGTPRTALSKAPATPSGCPKWVSSGRNWVAFAQPQEYRENLYEQPGRSQRTTHGGIKPARIQDRHGAILPALLPLLPAQTDLLSAGGPVVQYSARTHNPNLGQLAQLLKAPLHKHALTGVFRCGVEAREDHNTRCPCFRTC